jgi:hypothetical protein
LHPALYSFRNELSAITVRLLAYISGVAMLAVIAANLTREKAVEAAVAEVRPRESIQEWVASPRPHPALSLNMTEFTDKSASYNIYRHPDGGRKDVLGWDFAGGQPFARLTLLRPTGHPAFGPAAREIARDAGLTASDQVQPAGVAATKFGLIQLVVFSTVHGGEARRCLGFAAPFDTPPMQISGWFCQPGTAPVPRHLVVCALDRLNLLASGNDPRVAQLFARAELKRGFCPASGPSVAVNSDWVATFEGPELRGRL